MLIEPLIRQLHDLRLQGMAAALEAQLRCHDNPTLSFEERLGLLIEHEVATTLSPSACARHGCRCPVPLWRTSRRAPRAASIR